MSTTHTKMLVGHFAIPPGWLAGRKPLLPPERPLIAFIRSVGRAIHTELRGQIGLSICISIRYKIRKL
ncbi:MAG: hypothetical protein AAB330_03020 [Bacteroidota bacterium]